MPYRRFSGSLVSPKVDVIDMGNPFLNRTVDGFLKIGTVSASRVAAEETNHSIKRGDLAITRETSSENEAEEQSIRAQRILQQKREKMDQKNALRVDRGRRAPHTFLEDALEEDDEYDDHYESHRPSSCHRFEEDMEVESKSERRLINANRTTLPAIRSSRRQVEYSESEREESEYERESEEGERFPSRMEEPEHDEEDDEEEQEAEEARGTDAETEDDEEEPRQKSRCRLNRKEIESDGESPANKVSTHR
ncbi:hypothetical protein QJS10_CPB17g01962 [Acorus calamus]|uniref:Uncharacterized protein n=1 Tax=Acorus calamus TaxID=4465 RepID=A0AAV9CWK7_ACOCL|nr:hypothetical protein QJS10_CPB17g01962 [Acorus calamus]